VEAVRRQREVWLLLFVHLILGLGYWVVWQAYLPFWQAYGVTLTRFFLPPAVLLLLWLTLSVVLTVRRCRETLLVPLVALLAGFGLLFLQRLAGGAGTLAMQQGYDPAQFFALAAEKGAPNIVDTAALFLRSAQKQFSSFLIGWAVLLGLLLCWRDYRALARYKYLIAALAMLLLLGTTVFGFAVGGQTITLRLGPLAFQPHDPVKLLLVIFMAAYLVEKRELLLFARGRFGFLTRMDFRYLGPLITMWLVIMALIFKNDDLGAAMLLYGALLGILYLGTGRKTYLLVGLALSVAGIVAGYRLAKLMELRVVDRIDTRIAVWLDPWRDQHGAGYQIGQALMALGSGRVVGAGLAGGYPELIPAIYTDMVYAGISEDLGLLGAVAVIGLFMLLISRMFHVALLAEDRFGQLLAAGLALTMALQTWIILAGTLKFIPLTGIPLPFLSYGGTNLVVNLVMLGIVLKVAEARPPASG